MALFLRSIASLAGILVMVGTMVGAAQASNPNCNDVTFKIHNRTNNLIKLKDIVWFSTNPKKAGYIVSRKRLGDYEIATYTRKLRKLEHKKVGVAVFYRHAESLNGNTGFLKTKKRTQIWFNCYSGRAVHINLYD